MFTHEYYTHMTQNVRKITILFIKTPLKGEERSAVGYDFAAVVGDNSGH